MHTDIFCLTKGAYSARIKFSRKQGVYGNRVILISPRLLEAVKQPSSSNLIATEENASETTPKIIQKVSS